VFAAVRAFPQTVALECLMKAKGIPLAEVAGR